MNLTRSGITPEPRAAGAGALTFQCAGCGKPYLRLRWNQTRCRPNCGRSSEAANRARTITRAGPRSFLAIDGEGVTDPVTKDHRYVLIGAGDKHLSLDGARLEFGEILSFLWSVYEENPARVMVGFYLKYDFGQWLRTIPEQSARNLLDPVIIATQRQRQGEHLPPWPVTYGGWDFDYLQGRRFKFRPSWRPRWRGEELTQHILACFGCDGCRCPWAWAWINDVGSYFQCSFLKAIDPRGNPGAVCTLEEYRQVEAGKARRESAEFDPEMIAYNRLECSILERLMAQLEAGMHAEGLRPRKNQWFGPGQLSQLWLRKIEAPNSGAVREAVPEGARIAGRGAYFGGWFEIFWHGPAAGESWSYDINSAYPYVMSRLPCILHGTWRHYELGGQQLDDAAIAALFEGDDFGLVRAAVRGSHPVVGAMQHRNRNKTILRPGATEGWFWAHELAAAAEAGFIDEARLFERWVYDPCRCPPPLQPIAELYEGRLKLGKNSPAGKARKLIYNACAGKFQQSVGEPVFANPIYASAITAGCRTLILDAIAAHPKGAHDLLMVATDGVTFKSRHDALPLDAGRLGAWEETRHENLSLFMPGVYWDDAARARVAAGERGVFKSRGIAARDLSAHLAALDAAWRRFRSAGWPRLAIPVAFQAVSPLQALQRGDWGLCGRVSSGERVLSANPEQKRRASGPGRSAPWPSPADPASLPYDGTFGDELRAFADNEFGDNPDGPIGQLLAEVFHDE